MIGDVQKQLLSLKIRDKLRQINSYAPDSNCRSKLIIKNQVILTLRIDKEAIN